MTSPGRKAKEHSDKDKDAYYKKLVQLNLFLEPKGREHRNPDGGVNYFYIFAILVALSTLAYYCLRKV